MRVRASSGVRTIIVQTFFLPRRILLRVKLCYFHLGEIGRVGNGIIGSQSQIEQITARARPWITAVRYCVNVTCELYGARIVFVRDAGEVVAFVTSGELGLAIISPRAANESQASPRSRLPQVHFPPD